MARKMKVTTDTDAGTNTFVPIDSDGETIANIEAFVANFNDYPPAIQTRLGLHGLKQVLGDTYAGVVDSAAMVAAVKVRHDAMIGGDWSARTGDGSGRITDLATALAAVTGKELAAVVAWLSDKSKDEKKAATAAPPVAAELDAMRQRRAVEKAKASKKAAHDAGDETSDVLAGLVG